jgi:hypothetical protein
MSRKGIGRGHGRRQFAVENLEPRTMLAVDVYRSGDSLFVRGTSASEQVAIVQVDEAVYAVVGLNGTNIKGTNNPTLGGSGAEYKVISGINGNIDVDLRGGHDLLSVGNDLEGLIQKAIDLGFGSALGNASSVASDVESEFSLPGQLEVPRTLKIRMGDGNDGVGIVADVGTEGLGRIDADLGNGSFNAISIDPTTVSDDIILRAGSGNDTVVIEDTEIEQMLDVNLGDGQNSLTMTDTDLYDGFESRVGQSAIINTGKHDDFVEFEYTDIDINLIVRTNGGDDFVGYFGGAEGGGSDFAQIGVIADIDTGSGSDEVDVCDAEIGDDLIIKTQGEIDSVFVGCEGFIYETAQVVVEANVIVGDDLIINLGSGNDSDEESSAPFGSDAGAYLFGIFVQDNLEVHLGSGHDHLTAQFVEVGHDAFVNGNDGEDEIDIFSVFVEHNAFIDAGSSDDTVSIENAHVGNFFKVNMGSGNNDVLNIETSSADETVLDGGSGDNDTVVNGGGNDPGEFDGPVNFENEIGF